MRLGDKPLADMSEAEMLEALTALRSEREALRSEAIARKREREKGNVVKEPRAPRAKKQEEPPDDILAFLMGDKETL